MNTSHEDVSLYVRENEGTYRVATLEEAIQGAKTLLEPKVFGSEDTYFTEPGRCMDYVTLQLGSLPYEAFSVFFLTSQHRVFDYEEMFRGTINQTAVYPREVVRAALLRNAAAIVISHNHPSGQLTPSSADKLLTNQLREACRMVDVSVLDHILVAGNKAMSFAQRGLM